jgi:DNA-binding NarL/FixJ family response regulator
VSLHDQDEYRAAAVEAGADGFVAKRKLTTCLAPMIRRLFGKDRERPPGGSR